MIREQLSDSDSTDWHLWKTNAVCDHCSKQTIIFWIQGNRDFKYCNRCFWGDSGWNRRHQERNKGFYDQVVQAVEKLDPIELLEFEDKLF